MRDVLILGGTAWLGREIASGLISRGEAVTCLARGESGPVPGGATLVMADRTDPSAYDAVAAQDWDEVIELTYELALVTGALDALAARAAHWTLVSSVSVYAGNAETDADETAEVLEPTDLTEYGRAKVAAERASVEALGDRLLIARPGLIVGPGDGSDRFGYWVARFALAGDGPVLVPESDARFAQFIDVRDLARWIIDAGASRLTGAVNAVGDQHPLRSVLNAAAAVGGFAGETHEAADEWLLARDVRYWAGLRSLPLWLPAVDTGFMRRSNAAFRSSGGALRPVEETLADTLDDERSRGLDRARRSGLTREDEWALLDALVE